jgi:hypothetical protein
MFFFSYPIFTLLAYFTVLLGTHSISYISYFLRFLSLFTRRVTFFASLPPLSAPPAPPFFFAISPSADPSGREKTFDGRWVIYSNAGHEREHVSFVVLPISETPSLSK